MDFYVFCFFFIEELLGAFCRGKLGSLEISPQWGNDEQMAGVVSIAAPQQRLDLPDPADAGDNTRPAPRTSTPARWSTSACRGPSLCSGVRASECGATPEPTGASLTLWSPLREWARSDPHPHPGGRQRGRDKGKEKLG